MISTNRSQSIVAAAEMFQMHSVMTPGVIFLQQMGLGPLVLDISIMSAIIQYHQLPATLGPFLDKLDAFNSCALNNDSYNQNSRRLSFCDLGISACPR